MAVRTKPCVNAQALADTVQILRSDGTVLECTHRCAQPHTDERELFRVGPDGLCPFEDTCPHYQPRD